MDNVIEESGRIASLALFREIYSSQKDIYGVISFFLKEVIISEAKYNFSLSEITNLFNETFNFHIPEGVVKTSLENRLKDFIKKENGVYIANIAGEKNPSLVQKKNKISEDNGIIIDQIVDFIAKEKKEEIGSSEKEEIVHSFCCFLLDKTNNQKYSEYISAFIIKHQNDENFINKLRNIKEGVVLYTGIMFNDNINNVGSWNKELTIFLDTEILFDSAGYNGDLYKSLFDEFHTFVKEINQKNKKTLIRLRYFAKTKRKIENYFYKAERILTGNEVTNPGRPAMKYIINGSQSRSDIIEKKTLFFDLLYKNDILEDDYVEYFEEGNYQYNIEDIKLEKIISKSNNIGEDDIKESLEMLNIIHIRRGKDYGNNFDNIKYILLTGNNTTLNVAWHDDVRPSKTVPLATSLHFLTDKFWFKLNKGFGDNTFPKIFDVITKAQIVLSGHLNESISGKFEEQRERFRRGELSKEQIYLILANLRKESECVENINGENVSFVLESISQDNLNNALEEYEFIKSRANKAEEDKGRLEVELAEADAARKYQELEQCRMREESNKVKKELLSEKRKNLSSMEKDKNRIDRKINFEIYIFYILIFLGVIVLAKWILLFWNIAEPVGYIFGLITIVIFIVTGKKINYRDKYLNCKDRYMAKRYKMNKLDLLSYKKLWEEIDIIKKEIM